jgi:hypothetical protein
MLCSFSVLLRRGITRASQSANILGELAGTQLIVQVLEVGFRLFANQRRMRILLKVGISRHDEPSTLKVP